jgi:hypothetical protein
MPLPARGALPTTAVQQQRSGTAAWRHTAALQRRAPSLLRRLSAPTSPLLKQTAQKKLLPLPPPPLLLLPPLLMRSVPRCPALLRVCLRRVRA